MSESELFNDEINQVAEEGELPSEGQEAHPPQQQQPQQQQQQPQQPQPPQNTQQQGEQRRYLPPSSPNSAGRRRPQQRRPPQQQQQGPNKARRVEITVPPPASQVQRAPRSNGASRALQPAIEEARVLRAEKEKQDNWEAFNKALAEKQEAELWAAQAEARAAHAEGQLQRLQKQQRGQQQRELQIQQTTERELANQLKQASKRAEDAFERGFNQGVRVAEEAHAHAVQLTQAVTAGGRAQKPNRRGGKKHHLEASSSGV